MSPPERSVPSPTPGPRLYYLTNQLQLAMVSKLDRPLQALGLTPAIGRVLNAIARKPLISSSALARMLGITPQSIKQSIIALENAGLIERSVSPDDNRVMAAQLTAKGWQVRDKQMQAIADMYSDVFTSLNGHEMNTLVRLMTKAVTAARPQAME
jgi:DNA-binding MarR family transcriptional regulator